MTVCVRERTLPTSKIPSRQRPLDTVVRGSSERMAELADNSVYLMVASPPYNAGKDYDEDLTVVKMVDFSRTTAISH